MSKPQVVGQKNLSAIIIILLISNIIASFKPSKGIIISKLNSITAHDIFILAIFTISLLLIIALQKNNIEVYESNIVITGFYLLFHKEKKLKIKSITKVKISYNEISKLEIVSSLFDFLNSTESVKIATTNKGEYTICCLKNSEEVVEAIYNNIQKSYIQ